MKSFLKKTAVVMALTGAFGASMAHAEAETILVGYQFGYAYTPIMKMAQDKLVEKYAKEAGVDVKVEYRNMGTPSTIVKGMQSYQVQYGAIGVPSLISMGDKDPGSFKALGSIVSLPMWLNTNENVKSMCDLQGKIAVPSIGTSVQAVALQALAHKNCGSYKFFDSKMTGLTHPQGMAQVGSGLIGSHMTSPPFIYQELTNPKNTVQVRKLASSYDVFGPSTFILLVGSTKFKNENPKISEAVNKAFLEAQTWTDNNRAQAMMIYQKFEKPTQDAMEVLAEMKKGDVSFSAVPQGVGKYIQVMKDTNAVKNKSLTYSDLVFETVKGGN